MLVVAVGEHFDVVVADAVDVGWAALGEGEGEGLVELHLRLAREDAFVVVVTEDGGVGNLALDESVYDLEESLRYCQRV